MHDALREAADDRETFGLDQFAEMEFVEFAQTVADLLEQRKGQAGRMLDERKHFAARQKINLRGLRRRGRGGARAKFNDRHFAENLARTKPRKDVALALAGGNFHQAGLDEINAVARRAFLKDLLSGVELAFPGDESGAPATHGGSNGEAAEWFPRLSRGHFKGKPACVKAGKVFWSGRRMRSFGVRMFDKMLQNCNIAVFG